jgi:excisionase family DNA binding protein
MSSSRPASETLQFPERDDHLTTHESNGGSDLTLLTPHQVADRLRVSERWVRDHASRRSPRIPAVKLGVLLRFRASDVEKFVTQNSISCASKKHSGGV